MTAKQDAFDLAGVLVAHKPAWSGEVGHLRGDTPDHCPACSALAQNWVNATVDEPCLPYRLAALALDLQGKVARVEALANRWAASPGEKARWASAQVLAAALADPTPAARCPQQTPFVALSEPTCTRPEGHEGAHLFTSYDGKTPLEMMPK